MSRNVPATYNPPDPHRGFAVGEDIVDDSTGSDPHGGGDIARAVRYLYAQADAVHIVAQPWCSDQWFGSAAAIFGATAEASWFVSPDEAFTSLEVIIYYEANAANATGFRLKVKDNGNTYDLPAVAAAGAERRVRGVWSTSGLAAVGGGQATLELYTAGDGVSANKVKGVYVRRVPLTSGASIPAGKLYGGGFITPDSDAWVGNKPLTPDKVSDLSTALETLLAVRRAPYLTFARVGSITEEYVAGLGFLLPTSFARTHTYRGLSTADQDVDVFGDPTGGAAIHTETVAHLANVNVAAAVSLAPTPLLQAQGNGFVQGFGQYVIKLENPNALKTFTIEGP